MTGTNCDLKEPAASPHARPGKQTSASVSRYDAEEKWPALKLKEVALKQFIYLFPPPV